jgi:hypothetical protein
VLVRSLATLRDKHADLPVCKDGGTPVIRVVKGRPTADELAAVVAVLLAREGAGSPEPGRARRATAGWRRLERARVCPSPRSWQSPADV